MNGVEATGGDTVGGKGTATTWFAIFVGGFATLMINAICYSGKFKMETLVRGIFASCLCMCGVHASMVPLWGAVLIFIPFALLAPVLHKFVTGLLRKYLRLQDTTGIFSTFWLPAMYSAVFNWIFPLIVTDGTGGVQGVAYNAYWPRNSYLSANALEPRDKLKNAVIQFCCTLTALFFGALGGLLAGAIKIPVAWAALEEPFDDNHLFAKGENSDEE